MASHIKRLNIRLHPDEFKALRAAAEVMDRSINWFIRFAVMETTQEILAQRDKVAASKEKKI